MELKTEKQTIVLPRFYPRPFSKQLMSEHKFLWEGERGFLWWFSPEKGIWLPNGEDFIKNHLRKTTHNYEDTLKKKYYIEEIVSDIQECTLNLDGLPEPNTSLVPLQNGIYDLDTDTFREFKPEDYFTWKLPWRYSPLATCEYLERLINSTLPHAEVITLWELMAYALLRGYPYQKFFLLVGGGRNGKGTYMTIFSRLLGAENISSVSLGEIQDSRFAASNLYHKLANVSGELDYVDLENTRLLKQLTGGDLIQADRKYKKSIQFVNHAKLIFSTNQVPKTKDTTDAFYRRVFLIEFPNQFKINPSLDMKIREKTEGMTKEYEGLMVKVLMHLKRLKEQNFIFTKDQNIEDIRKIYNHYSTPIGEFIEEYCERTYNHEDFISKFDFRQKLNTYLIERKLNSFSDNKIGKEMKDLGFEGAKKESSDEQKRCWAWVGTKWK